MANVPWGTRTFVAATLTELTNPVTAISNANPAVVSSTAHGLAAGDLVLIQNDWSDVTDVPLKVATVPDANTFTLQGVNTTDTTAYPPSLSAGTAYEVGTKTEVTKIVGVARDSGGDPKKVTFQYFDEYNERQITTGFAPAAYEFDLDADTFGTTQYNLLKAMSDGGTRTVLFFEPKKANWTMAMPGKITLNENPSFGGTITVNKVTFDSDGKTSRFAK